MDVWHSRAAVPTRRVALGNDLLNFDPPPGHGGLLLAAIVAFYASTLKPDSRKALGTLARQLERGDRVAQPHLRYRLQQDRVGLSSTKHRLIRTPTGEIVVDLDRNARREPQLLAAMYRASQVPEPARTGLFILLRSAMRWRSADKPDQVDLADMMAYLTGGEHGEQPWLRAGFMPGFDLDDGQSIGARWWALQVMEMGAYDGNTKALQRQFRRQMRQAHPDHGGESTDAGSRIAALTAARRILLNETDGAGAGTGDANGDDNRNGTAANGDGDSTPADTTATDQDG